LFIHAVVLTYSLRVGGCLRLSISALKYQLDIVHIKSSFRFLPSSDTEEHQHFVAKGLIPGYLQVRLKKNFIIFLLLASKSLRSEVSLL
jgi:hypothetical protein